MRRILRVAGGVLLVANTRLACLAGSAPVMAAGQSPSVAALQTMQAYTRAFASQRYDVMWSLLAPAARAKWGGLAQYSLFYRTKFAPVRLVGTAVDGPRVTGGIVRIPLSLILAWRGQGPPGILSLFTNLCVTLIPTAAGWRVANGGPLDPDAPIIPPPGLPERTLAVPILMYHHVSNAPPLAQSQVGLTVTADAFAAQLDYLARHGYHAIRLHDLFNALYYGLPLPPHPVVLTFDDGYQDAYTVAFPLLRRHGMVGEFNIITGYLGETIGVNTYVTWAQVSAMAAAGMEMESHTVDHQDLGLVDTDKAIYELRFSRSLLAFHIHRAVQFLAYPSGEPFRSGTVQAQERILNLLPQYGYVGALLDQNVPSVLQDARNPFGLRRVRVSRDEPLDSFAASLGS